MPVMAFRGWPEEAIEFLEGLEADNSKAYWTAHKDVYERDVRTPMVELVDELTKTFGEGKIFRPYRDVRFSKNKSPYKTNIAATLSEGGYIQLTADALGVGSGIYMMAPDQIARYRQAVADGRTGPALERIIAALEKKGINVSSHEVLKTAPRGYAKDHPRIALLRNKDLVGWQEWAVGPWLASAQPKQRIVGFFRATSPLNAWLADHVGPSSAPS
jgi:uncharacterized protein (TIGR02453 family)